MKMPKLSTVLFFTFFIVSTVIVLSYFNFEKTPILVKDSSCKCKSGTEEFEIPLRYSYGKFKGQCVNSCARRTSFAIDNKSETGLQVANVYHLDEFWQAKIPLNSIVKTEIVFENFASIVNHVAIRFIFSEPIELKSQDISKPIRTVKLNQKSIVFSPEAAPPNELSYSLFDGFMGRYGVIFRSYSSENYRKMTTQLRHKTIYKTLKLDIDEQKKLFLYSYLSFYNFVAPNYQLIFNNCATISLDLVLESKGILRSKGWDIWDMLDPFRGVPISNPIGGTIRSLYWWRLVEDDLEFLNSKSS